MDLEDILVDVGEYGRYQQLLLWFVFLPAQLPFGSQVYGQLFMTLLPPHWCKQHDAGPNGTQTSSPLPKDPLTGRYLQCQAYEFEEGSHNNYTATLVECRKGWEYDNTWLGEDHSVVTQWDLVCEEAWLPPLAMSLFNVGGCLGHGLYCLISCRCGRRSSFFLFLVAQSALGVAGAFSPSFSAFVLLRFCLGLTSQSVTASPAKLALELTSRGHRVHILLAVSLARGLGVCLLAAVAYLIRDWAHLALTTSVPFAAFLLYWWVLPESPRWLVSRGRYESVGRMLTSMANSNGRCLPSDYVAHLKRRFRLETALRGGCRDVDESYGFGHLLKTPNLRRKTLLLTIVWFVNTTVYLGLTYYALELSDQIYLNFVLSASAELGAVILLTLGLQRWGRRLPLCLGCSVGGITCLGIYGNQKGSTAGLLLYVVSKGAASWSTALLPIWAGELLPLVARDVGLEIMELISLLGPTLLPPLIYQGKSWPVLPLAALGGLQVVSALVSLGLPETKGHRACRTLREAEDFGKHRTWRDWFRIRPKKSEQRNGILKNRGGTQQSPILSLLRRQESLRRGSSEVDLNAPTEQTEQAGPSQDRTEVETLKVTVV